MVKTAVLVSGGGVNLQSLIEASAFGKMPQCELTAVISSAEDAYAVRRAKMAGVPVYTIDRNMFPNATSYGFALLDKLRDLDVELVVLAGYDAELTQPIFKNFEDRIISSYPALLPAFALDRESQKNLPAMQLQAGVRVSGATAYFVREGENAGPIILQKPVEVFCDDAAATLERRILEEGENDVLPRAVDLFTRGLLSIKDGVVLIAPEEN